MILGVSRRIYIDRELDKIKPEVNQVTFDGEIYDGYTATQMQRRTESAIRKTKWELTGYDAVNDPEAFSTQSVKLRQQKKLYADFSKAADLPLQNERIQVLGFDKSMSSKAVWAVRKNTFTNAFGEIIIKAKNPLPDYEHAIIPKEKFIAYALNFEKDINKARAFKKALGYTIDNVDDLIANIKQCLPYFESI